MRDGKFPRSRELGGKSAWLESEVEAWIASLPTRRLKGDAKASAIFAEAFGKDPQFAQFYRSLEAYRSSFRSKNDLMIVDPGSDFFKAMRGSGAAPVAPARK